MKLEGSLDAFSLPDIFQLLSFTKKSGGLHLRRAAIHGCVYFADGSVTGATSDDGRQALARRLIGASAVGDDHLGAAVERAAGGEVGIAKALHEAGAVDEETLRATAAEQAIDAVFDFLRWADGDFAFSVGEEGPDDVGVRLSVEEIVEQARGRLEAWDHACQVIPAPDTVLVVPVAVDEDPQLSRSEWSLLALVDGRRTVDDLVALAGRGDFAVVSALAGLVERQLLVVRAGDGEQGAQALARRHAILARLESKPTAPEPEPADNAGETAAETGEAGGQAADAKSGETPSRAGFEPAPAAATPADELPPDESLFAGVANAEVSSASTVASVLAAAASGADESRSTRDEAAPRLVADTRGPVIPPRPEPFMPRRRPEFPEESPRAVVGMGSVAGAAAVAANPDAAQPAASAEAKVHIERDPSVNKSLLLRLIAGVRGL